MKWTKFDINHNEVDGGTIADTVRPDLADLVHGVDTLAVVFLRKDGTSTRYERDAPESVTWFTNTGCAVEVVGATDVLHAPVVVTTPVGAVINARVWKLHDDHIEMDAVGLDGFDTMRLFGDRDNCPDRNSPNDSVNTSSNECSECGAPAGQAHDPTCDVIGADDEPAGAGEIVNPGPPERYTPSEHQDLRDAGRYVE